MTNELIIINNEAIFQDSNSFFCNNVDIKSIPEGLSKNLKISMIARKSNTKKSHKINLLEINIASNILIFLFNIFKTFKNKKTHYLLISISPYTFFAYLLLFVFRKKIFVYLRSNGYEEYKCILGFIGPFLYHIMFVIVSWKANLISCRNHLLNGKKGQIVSPSQLDKNWFLSRQKPDLSSIKLLYIGRIKIEKGIFSLLEIFKNIEKNITLSIVSSSNNRISINQKNVQTINFLGHHESIMKIYDSHNIFVLPSFTEAHPQVLDESLSRMRPVIMFEEISHVIGNRKGVFVSKRNFLSLSKTISYIMDNYYSIQKEMAQNILPTKDNFLKKMSFIIQEKQ